MDSRATSITNSTTSRYFSIHRCLCDNFFFKFKDLAGHGKEEAIEEEKKKKGKPDAASFPAEGKTEEQKKKEENLFFFNETEFKDEEEDTNAAKRATSEQQAGSLSNLLDLNNSQVRSRMCCWKQELSCEGRLSSRKSMSPFPG